jgi:hypothetical protein
MTPADLPYVTSAPNFNPREYGHPEQERELCAQAWKSWKNNCIVNTELALMLRDQQELVQSYFRNQKLCVLLEKFSIKWEYPNYVGVRSVFAGYKVVWNGRHC